MNRVNSEVSNLTRENEELKSKVNEVKTTSTNGYSTTPQYQSQSVHEYENEASKLQQSIIEAQELNRSLQANFIEWQNANQVVEKAILDAQAINESLQVNLAQWNASNQGIQDIIQNRQSKSIYIILKLS